MVLSDQRTFIVQENKIDAPLGSGQLSHYATLIKESGKKNKGLIYVRRKLSPEWKDKRRLDGVPFRHITWDEVAFLLNSGTPRVAGKKRWLREELFKFLEVHKMTNPSAIDPSKLRRAWKDFKPQQDALTKMIAELHRLIEQTINGKNYRLRVSRPGEDPGISIFKKRGKLQHVMEIQELWAWCGVYIWGEEIYAGMDIAWGEKHETRIGTGFRNLLERNGYEHYSEQNDPTYPHEGYLLDKRFDLIIGQKNHFEKQCERVAKWFLPRSKTLVKLLDSLDRRW